MAKVLIVGDIHGRNNWELVRYLTGVDKIVFVGDYVDSYDKKDVEIYHNLKEIIQFKLDYPDKVELLLGNHDIQYIFSPHFQCSGFRPHMLPYIKALFDEYIDLFNIAYQTDNHLFTHAGVTNAWLAWARDFIVKYGLLDDNSNIGDILNK